ncbi:unnamed protein product [Ectocarpus sp. 8 AP-2014]
MSTFEKTHARVTTCRKHRLLSPLLLLTSTLGGGSSPLRRHAAAVHHRFDLCILDTHLASLSTWVLVHLLRCCGCCCCVVLCCAVLCGSSLVRSRGAVCTAAEGGPCSVCLTSVSIFLENEGAHCVY